MSHRCISVDALLAATAEHCTIADIADRLGVSYSTVWRMVGSVELMGLVNSSEGRGVLRVWELTDAGRERLSRRAH